MSVGRLSANSPDHSTSIKLFVLEAKVMGFPCITFGRFHKNELYIARWPNSSVWVNLRVSGMYGRDEDQR